MLALNVCVQERYHSVAFDSDQLPIVPVSPKAHSVLSQATMRINSPIGPIVPRLTALGKMTEKRDTHATACYVEPTGWH